MREKKEEKWHEWEDEKQENKNDRFKRIQNQVLYSCDFRVFFFVFALSLLLFCFYLKLFRRVEWFWFVRSFLFSFVLYVFLTDTNLYLWCRGIGIHTFFSFFRYSFVNLYECVWFAVRIQISGKISWFNISPDIQRTTKREKTRKKRKRIHNVLLNKHRNSNSEFRFIYHRELSVWQRRWL